MASMKQSFAVALCAALAITSACEDTRSTTLEPVGALGFGTVLSKTSTNLPRGFVNFPAAVVASATPANDSVIVTLSGLDSLTTGTYTVWFGNDSATKWVRATTLNIRQTRVDSTINAAGDPVFTTTVTNNNGVSGFRSGGSNKTFRVATSRATATGMAATDSLNVVLVSIETAATPGAAPGEVRSLWARRSQATANAAGIRFGTFAPRIPTAANAGNPGTNQEFVIASSSTAGVATMTIVPRGRVEVRGKIMVANDSNYFRPPVGYYYNAYAVKFDTTGRFNDTVYIGRRTSPYPQRISLFEADKTNPAPDVVFDSPRVIFAMATRVSTDTIPDANTTPAWLNFGLVRVNIQSKYSQEGFMGPNTVLEAALPKSVRGR
jgi:hypothetical protein